MSQLTDLLGPAYGMFDNFAGYAWIASVIIGLALGFIGVPFILWGIFSLVVTIGFGGPAWLILAFLVITLIGSIKPIRAVLLSGPIMALLKKLEFLPKISDTEREAIEAGTVWAEGAVGAGATFFFTLG